MLARRPGIGPVARIGTLTVLGPNPAAWCNGCTRLRHVTNAPDCPNGPALLESAGLRGVRVLAAAPLAGLRTDVGARLTPETARPRLAGLTRTAVHGSGPIKSGRSQVSRCVTSARSIAL